MIASRGSDGEYNDYGAAEQAVMAIASIKSVLEQSGSLTPAEKTGLKTALGSLYAVLQDADEYRPERMAATLRSLARAF